jgi:hypothetical protein
VEGMTGMICSHCGTHVSLKVFRRKNRFEVYTIEELKQTLKLQCNKCFSEQEYKVDSTKNLPKKSVERICTQCSRMFSFKLKKINNKLVVIPSIPKLPHPKTFKITCYHCNFTQQYTISDRTVVSRKKIKVCINCGKNITLYSYVEDNVLKVGTIKVEKICKNCGGKFVPQTRRKEYCSKRCQENKYWEDIYENIENNAPMKFKYAKIFQFLNDNPKTSREKILTHFFDENPNEVSQVYYKWIKITNQKYVER